MSPIEGASIWMQYLTAYGLIEFGKMQQGHHVLITAAASSVGLAAIQLANAVGAIPIARIAPILMTSDPNEWALTPLELISRKAQAPKTVPWTLSMTAVELFVMPERLSAAEKDSWLGHCGWCNREMGEEGERIAINARFRDKKYYRKHEGMMVSFVLADAARTVVAYVVTRDSPAKKEGKEVIFQVCSDRCGLELNTALSKEMNLLS